MTSRLKYGWVVLVCMLSGCALPDETLNDEREAIAHQDVDGIPESIRDGTQQFTGVIIYGDLGYTGLTGNRNYPNVRVNGLSAGKCEKGRAILIPLRPGMHLVSAHSENVVENTVTIDQGETAYFRCNFLRFGIVLPPAVLAPADAETAYSVVNGN